MESQTAVHADRFPCPACLSSTVWLPQSDGLPPRQARVHGRAHAVELLAEKLAERRIVTVCGTGGMGKTTVALAVAEHMARQWRQGVAFVDLAGVADPAKLPAVLANALVMEGAARISLDGIIYALRSHHMLLVLDSCERQLDGVADMVEQLLEGAQGVRILATSREPLHLEGEWVYRLPALEAPPGPAPGRPALTLNQAMNWPSVRLFVERAHAGPLKMALDEHDAQGIGEICQRLDGIPLAIELAAARAGQFGVRGLTQRLSETCLALHGSPHGKQRHRTLEATLDWSYALLSERERTLLHRLSVFRRPFALEEALGIGAGHLADWADTLDALAGLVHKSMVATIADTGPARYRLLETTRSYALARLAESGEHDMIMARFAALG